MWSALSPKGQNKQKGPVAQLPSPREKQRTGKRSSFLAKASLTLKQEKQIKKKVKIDLSFKSSLFKGGEVEVVVGLPPPPLPSDLQLSWGNKAGARPSISTPSVSWGALRFLPQAPAARLKKKPQPPPSSLALETTSRAASTASTPPDVPPPPSPPLSSSPSSFPSSRRENRFWYGCYFSFCVIQVAFFFCSFLFFLIRCLSVAVAVWLQDSFWLSSSSGFFETNSGLFFFR